MNCGKNARNVKFTGNEVRGGGGISRTRAIGNKTKFRDGATYQERRGRKGFFFWREMKRIPPVILAISVFLPPRRCLRLTFSYTVLPGPSKNSRPYFFFKKVAESVETMVSKYFLIIYSYFIFEISKNLLKAWKGLLLRIFHLLYAIS